MQVNGIMANFSRPNIQKTSAQAKNPNISRTGEAASNLSLSLKERYCEF